MEKKKYKGFVSTDEYSLVKINAIVERYKKRCNEPIKNEDKLLDRQLLTMLLAHEFEYLTIQHLVTSGIGTTNSSYVLIRKLVRSKFLTEVSDPNKVNSFYVLTKKGYNHISEMFDLTELTGRSGYANRKANNTTKHNAVTTEIVLTFMSNPNVKIFSYQLEYELHNTDGISSYKPNRKSLAFRVDARLIVDGQEIWIEADMGTENITALREKYDRISEYAQPGIKIIYVYDNRISKGDMVKYGKKLDKEYGESIRLITDIFNHYMVVCNYDEDPQDYEAAKATFGNLLSDLSSYAVNPLLDTRTQNNIVRGLDTYNALSTQREEESGQPILTRGELLMAISELKDSRDVELKYYVDDREEEIFLNRVNIFYRALERLEHNRLELELLDRTELMILPLSNIETCIHKLYFSPRNTRTLAIQLLERMLKDKIPCREVLTMRDDRLRQITFEEVYYHGEEVIDQRPYIVIDHNHSLSDRLKLTAFLDGKYKKYTIVIIVANQEEEDKSRSYYGILNREFDMDKSIYFLHTAVLDDYLNYLYNN